MPLTEAQHAQLQEILRSTGVKSAQKLRTEAIAQGLPITHTDAKEAFSRDAHPATRQVLAPAQRPLGKSAAEAPGSRLQADLMDFSRNTDPKKNQGKRVALQVTDVFTRQAFTKALPSKKPAVVNEAFKELADKIPSLPKGYVVSTDRGDEFSGLDRALPKDGIHRAKDVNDRNALAVNDRTMQTLKQDLAHKVGEKGGGWAQHLDDVTKAYNARSNSAVGTTSRPSSRSKTTPGSSSTTRT